MKEIKNEDTMTDAGFRDVTDIQNCIS